MTLTAWYKEYKKLTSVDLFLISEQIQKFKNRPLLSLLTPVYNTKTIWLKECIDSVLNQIYTNWELCLCDNASNPETSKILQEYANKDPRIKIIRLEVNQGGYGGTNAALDIATGDYIGFLDSDDTLSLHALYLIAQKLDSNPDANLIYTDENIVDAEGACLLPFFKPDFAPDLLMSEFYMSHLSMYKSELLKRLRLRESAGSHDYDVALRAVEIIPIKTIYHIPVLAYNYRQHKESVAFNTESYCIDGAMNALRGHLERIGRKATVYYDWPHYRVKYHLDEYPHVNICIASINKNDILIKCIVKLLSRTNYINYSICLCVTKEVQATIINRFGSLVKSGKIFFAERAAALPFNYSILANSMNAICKGPILCFLNDDVEPLNYDWLEEMVAQAIHPTTGAVGAKLLYPNLTYQHVGCVLGIENTCAHAFKGLPDSEAAYFGRAKLVGNYSMVTGACLMMRKEIYDEVGGYDLDFQVAYGDVDICLKIIKAGYYNVFTPHAAMLHLEAYSRGIDNTIEKQQRFIEERQLLIDRYGVLLQNDPMYNPNLSLRSVNFEIAPVEESRYKKPWLV